MQRKVTNDKERQVMRKYFEERDDQRSGELRPEVAREGEVSQRFLWTLIVASTVVVAVVTFAVY